METVEEKEVASKVVVPFQNLPVDMDKAWDAGAARARLAKWAGGPDKEGMDWTKYRRAFLWFDSGEPENFGSYKFPIADIVNGKLTAIYAAISAAAGRLGATDIPAGDVARMRTHLGKYYKKMDKEPPWAKKQVTENYALETPEQRDERLGEFWESRQYGSS